MERRERGTRVFVGGLTEDIQKEDLEEEFSKVGKIVNVWVARNPPGFGFVEFDDRADADEAVNSMNGQLIHGTKIRVDMARERRGRGGGRGGFQGGRGFRGGFDRRGPSYDSYRGDGGFSRRGGGYRYNEGGYGSGSNYRSRSPMVSTE
ncbi:RNA-binding protein Rsf1-like isoform X2 [Tachypleus tridentatus]|uniref:RNA-binding protein Rsf1-like isoform X2 n=1 Tax=Tachypleus tridentatus TaxID=6853 RepID=UPI003FD5EF23